MKSSKKAIAMTMVFILITLLLSMNAGAAEDMGTCTHFAGEKGSYSNLDLIKAAGFTYIRDEMYWNVIEKTQGVYTFPAFYDTYVNEAAARGLNILIALDYSNPSVYPESSSMTTDGGRQAYANYCYQVVNRYKDKVKYWEVWNEPSFDSKTVYTPLLKAAYTAIKSADPNAYVISCGGGGTGGGPDGGYAASVIDQMGIDYMEGFSIHPYVAPWDPESGYAASGSVIPRCNVPIVWNHLGAYINSWVDAYADYKIICKKSGKSLDVVGASLTENAGIKQYTYNGAKNQIWRIVTLGNGYFKIVNKNSQMALGVANGSTANNAVIQQGTYNGSNSQQWQMTQDSNGYYKIINRNSGKALDVTGASLADDAVIQQYTYGGADNQLWQVTQLNPGKKVSMWATEIGWPTGTFAKGVDETAQAQDLVRTYLLSRRHRIDPNNPNRVFVYDFQDDGTDPNDSEQHFGLIRADYSLKPSYTALSVFGNTLGDKKYNKAYVEETDIRYCYEYGSDPLDKVIVLWTRSAASMATTLALPYSSVTLRTMTGQDTTVYPSGGQYTFTASPSPVYIIPNYKIFNKKSGKVLDVVDASTANGAQIQQWTAGGGDNQKWQVTKLSNGYYKIINRLSGKALDVTGASVANNAIVQQWPYGGAANQQWQITEVSTGYYNIVNKNSGKALDVTGASLLNGALIQQYTYGGADNQLWSFQ